MMPLNLPQLATTKQPSKMETATYWVVVIAMVGDMVEVKRSQSSRARILQLIHKIR
jgi:hypothetical protein